jgi:heat shock protein HtpX
MNSYIKSNQRKAFLLLLFSTSFLGVISYFLGVYLQNNLLIYLFISFTLISPWLLYYNSDKIVIKSTNAVLAPESSYKKLHNLVEELSIATNIPKPKIYIVDDPAPNAFATGRNIDKGVVAVTTGLLEKMNREELEGVIAHEMAHIVNRDTLLGTIAAIVATSIIFISDIGLRAMVGARREKGSSGILFIFLIFALILAPIAAGILRASHSRSRESLADASAIKITRNPEGLKNALLILKNDSTEVKKVSPGSSALWIEEPNPKDNNRPSLIARLYATHPPLEERIKKIDDIINNIV